ncbi:GAF and ANTAR domain-containing protein [Microbacterium sp. CFBP9034]|uniref:GAF and ANTAR domain-containing protein n=1 Tax=Microbacterium sp. CFBP9034 TaxID=3096540 RepID=UPI002A69A549|nr:GAF and ANTAR domain-containing protein [Microbacterium sp. CFBP9034]MDY0910452.1 GAF and ANTAR domain-containing protein [Microbacterium sp. CFBP9034]
MTETTRDTRLFQTFATLADTLVDDYDVVELLQVLVDACRDILGATAAGILIADETGELELIASTSEASRIVEIMQLGAQAGPCIECFRSRRAVSVPAIAESPERWEQFRAGALAQGFASAEALPLRLRENTIGTLNLLNASEGRMREEDVVAAQAFADVATIGILHERSVRRTEVLAEQLRFALDSRIIIEQAKGVVSFTRDVPVDEAFGIIRAYARRHRLTLSSVAARLVRRELSIEDD